MKIASVTLENFKRHEKTEVSFAPGTNVISGPNYAGKSTILQAILFAMFGAKAVPTEADDLVRRGAKRMRVSVILVPTGTAGDDSHYEIERTKSGATVTYRSQGVEEKTEATGHSAVTAWVENFVGLKAKRFAQLKYAEQKETEALLQFGTTELHALLEELSGADTVNEAIKRCSGIVSAQEAVVSALGEVCQIPDMAAARRRGDELEATHRAASESLADWQECLTRREQEHAAALQRIQEATDHNRGVAERLQRLQDANAAVEAARVRHADADAAFSTFEKAEARAERLDAARVELAAAQAELAGLDEAARVYSLRHTRLVNAREAVSLREQQLAEAKDAVDKALTSVDIVSDLGTLSLPQLEADHQVDFARLNELKGEAKRLKAALASAACPTCGRDYDEHAGHRAGMEAELAKVTADGTALADAINARLENVNALREAVSALASAQDVHTTAKARLQVAQEALASAEAEGPLERPRDPEQARNRVFQLKTEVKELEAFVAGARAAAARCAEAASALQGAQARLAALPPAGATMEVPTEVARHTSGNLAIAQDQVKFYTAEVPRLHAELNRLVEAIQREEQVAARREEAKRKRDVAKELARYLRENRDRFMGEIWASVMAAASGFVAACTGGDIERVYRDSDGKFRYVEKGETFTAIGSASGAQRSLMGLGIKIAMSQLARSELNVILLDEPSADMDSKVSAAMTALLGTLGQQVIMVSHREMDGTMADNVITLEG